MASTIERLRRIPNIFGDGLDELREKISREVLFRDGDGEDGPVFIPTRIAWEQYIKYKKLRDDMEVKLYNWWQDVIPPELVDVATQEQITKLTEGLIYTHTSIPRFINFLDAEVLPFLYKQAVKP
jgi:hypothetical protein